MADRYDVIVVGGGFAGVTAARECALRGRRTLLLEARDRLGGRTWSARWNDVPIEYGGAWVHWHQPHTFSELTRAGLAVAVSDDTGRAHWHVGDERRSGTIEARDAIARRGWDRFVEGAREALPQPHAPLAALAELARFDRRLATPVAAVVRNGKDVEVHTRDGEAFTARSAIVAVALNALGAIEFSPELPEDKRRAIELGQASRGVKVMIHARGENVLQNSIRFRHPFGYLGSEVLLGDGTQLMIGFGGDAERCDPADLPAMQANLDEILPGYEVLDAVSHDWFADEFSLGTWAVHRPGWYEHHHAAMRRPEGNVVLAGSDLANGWAGFIDGAIESGLRAGAWATALD